MPTTFHVSHWRILLHLALSDSKLTLAYVKDFCRSSVAKEQRAAPGNQLGQSPSSYLVEMQKVFNGICSFDRMAPKETEERLGIVLSKLTEARGHFEEALNVRHISEDIDERSRPNLTKLFPTGELESLVHKLSAQIQHVKARMHNRKARERGCHAAYELQQFMDAAAADLRRAKEDQERQNREAEAARHQVDIMVDQSRKRYREKQDFALVLGL
ncbi:hypothetical protein P152DRAFT_84898 [Eremomyces bilateralis CBS 781.70]|uniref:Uncharacterized protein n=1 Tax=Eremomyces bilateralis CBS 781.70 TaxID=1392243 RepID=A0A6G1FYQ3_9PEZI|nr:uncharacterized protein P152DRAFT_84898 [Eremomyces bilateralis CBS 781.70]KAF1810831.1 hypothetical protein P152DRAFT_84898 [Eremomyces bilateralis CBS 781.70]